MSVTKIGVSERGVATYELTNDAGVRVQIITLGARLHKLFLPTKIGVIDVLGGFDDADGYFQDNPYFNAVIGRTVNRIGNSTFTLNGKTYKLHPNEGRNCLHGGKTGFFSRIFDAKPLPEENALRLTYVSPAGEENFPGTLTFRFTYRLTERSELVLTYDATTDEDTLFNPTHHAYFNLSGDFRSVMDTEIFVDADRILVSDQELVCQGETMDVRGTTFDFTSPRTFADGLDKTDPLIVNQLGGYDCNYILREGRDPTKPVATAYCARSGVKVSVFTDRPCMQLYSGNFLDGTVVGKAAFPYQSLFCMETQGYPNACNVPSFPSITLKKGERFLSETTYAFSF